MILSDVDIRKELAAGRVRVEPFDENSVQPSSIDMRVDRFFRVFANTRYPYIDVRKPMEDLTELVEASEDEPLILHPGEFILGSTLERVTLPDDVVARVEGKSSLGRLGLLIHSSLPGSETILLDGDEGLQPRRIGDVVKDRHEGRVVSFDPHSFEIGYHEITGWFEGPEDRIFEVILASGRSVRVTAGHNLFTLDSHGELVKVRTGELRPGTLVAIPGRIPEPAYPSQTLDLLSLVPETEYDGLVCEGPSVEWAFGSLTSDVVAAMHAQGYRHVDYYRARGRLPLSVARQLPELVEALGAGDRLGVRGGRSTLPMIVEIDNDFAWLLGLYVAEGYRRRNQCIFANTDPTILERATATLAQLGVRAYVGDHAVAGCSTILSSVIGWLGVGASAATKRIPSVVFSWPSLLLRSFYEGFVDGDGSRERTRTSLWSDSEELVGDFLMLLLRLGLRAGASSRRRGERVAYQVSIPLREHKLLTSVPFTDQLLVGLRKSSGIDQATAAALGGYKHPTDLCNIERRSGRDALRLRTVRRLRRLYDGPGPDPAQFQKLARLADGDMRWDRVVEVRDTGQWERVYDLEVRPKGTPVENFLAGSGGVFVSNTAGFVDAGWDGHLTLELSNVANLPITIYPGMKIGQLCLFRMTSPAERPYGSKGLGSKYQGQRGPTPSSYYKNFEED